MIAIIVSLSAILWLLVSLIFYPQPGMLLLFIIPTLAQMTIGLTIVAHYEVKAFEKRRQIEEDQETYEIMKRERLQRESKLEVTN